MGTSKGIRSVERRRRSVAAVTPGRAGSAVQGRLAESIHNSPYVQSQRGRLAGMFGGAARLRSANEVSAPGRLESGIEPLSGVSIADDRPAHGVARLRGAIDIGSTVQRASPRLSGSRASVVQLSKEKVAAMVRTVKELTEDLDKGKFAIGGSLALMMWHWALNPDEPLHREPGDIDILLSHRDESLPIGKKIIDKREEGLPESMKAPMVSGFPSRFYGKSMMETEYGGFGVDLKEAGKKSRWGEIESLMMPIIDLEEEYSLPVQSPEALLRGLIKKLNALKGQEDERLKVLEDIEVAKKVIQQFEDYQKSQ